MWNLYIHLIKNWNFNVRSSHPIIIMYQFENYVILSCINLKYDNKIIIIILIINYVFQQANSETFLGHQQIILLSTLKCWKPLWTQISVFQPVGRGPLVGNGALLFKRCMAGRKNVYFSLWWASHHVSNVENHCSW